MVMRQNASTGQMVDDGQKTKKEKASKKSLQVKVHSPFRVYFEGEAESVSAVNNTGPFDVLPEHHKFITLLNSCDLVVRSFGEEKKIRISRGIMHVKNNTVTVFLDV